jgi:uncharacterized membrane protein
MIFDNRPTTDTRFAPIFSAVITPHRSLGPQGFLILMSAIAMVSFCAGMVFLWIGAWPVFGFFGLDAVLIYWVFRVNNRRAAAYEEICISPTQLTVRNISHRGRVSEWTANPLWVRLEQDTHDEYGIHRLFLVSRGRRVPVGQFLGPQEKPDFSRALSLALWKARQGPVFPAQ